MHLTRDGVKLAYEEAGAGPAVVFVHGWTCDRSHFAPQVRHFAQTHRCVSVDLRGHGESDKPEQAYTIDGFADDVIWICGELGVTRAVLAGHSMGGAIALAVAARSPDLAAAVVMLDPAILFPAELHPVIAELIAGLRSPDGAQVVRRFAEEQFFTKASNPALKQRLVDGMCRTPMHVVVSAFEGVSAFDSEAALRALTAPALHIEAQPRSDRVARLREVCPNAFIGMTVGAGHFHQLEVPNQINAMIERFLVVNLL